MEMQSPFMHNDHARMPTSKQGQIGGNPLLARLLATSAVRISGDYALLAVHNLSCQYLQSTVCNPFRLMRLCIPRGQFSSRARAATQWRVQSDAVTREQLMAVRLPPSGMIIRLLEQLSASSQLQHEALAIPD